MRFSVRTKVMVSIGLTIFLGMVANAVWYSRELENNYHRAIEWQSSALAQSILTSIDYLEKDGADFKQEGEQLSLQCQQLFERNQAQHVTYIAVVDERGKFLAHNDAAQIGKTIESAAVIKLLGWRDVRTEADHNMYHTITPVMNSQKVYRQAAIIIGVDQKTITQYLARLRSQAFGIIGVFLVIACGIVFLSVHLTVTKPIRYLAELGERLSVGNLIHSINLTKQGNEIALLGTVFIRISDYLREITDIAEHVATGSVTLEVHKRSKRDLLGCALQEMLTYLQAAVDVASHIAKGDLTVKLSLRSDFDTFGRSMRDMTWGLQSLIQQIRSIAEQISVTGSNIAAYAEQDMAIAKNVETSVKKMAATLTIMGNSIEEVANNMDVLSSSVEETSASVSVMTTSITNIASNTYTLREQTRNTISTLTTATDTLRELAEQAKTSRSLSEETIQDALEGQQAVEEVMISMNTIQQTNLSTVETITRFAKQTEDIGSILDVIQEITDQSSLLALNASIIAAQAGSHGKGFAVIADEMRNLANKVSASTKNIAAIVQVVQKETATVVKKIHKGTVDIAQGVERTTQAQEMLQKITTSALRSSNVVTQIVDALQLMQKTTGEDIRQAIERVYAMTSEITEATDRQKTSTIQINQAVVHITKLALQTQQTTSEQLEGVQQILGMANFVKELTDQNLTSSQHIDHTVLDLADEAKLLLQSVDRFKLESNPVSADEATPAIETPNPREIAGEVQ